MGQWSRWSDQRDVGESVYDADGKSIKKTDKIEVNRRLGLLHGKVTRITPAKEAGRRYRMVGYRRDETFFAIFWSTDPGVPSHGCWHASQKRQFPDLYEGYYLNLDRTTKFGIKPIRLDFVKKTDGRISRH